MEKPNVNICINGHTCKVATGYEHQISPDKNFRKDVHRQTGSEKWVSSTMEYVCNLHDTPCKTVHQNYYIRVRPLFGKYHGRWSKIVVSKGVVVQNMHIQSKKIWTPGQ